MSMKRRNLQGVRTYGSSEEPTTRSFLMLLYAYSIRVTYSCSDLSVVIYCTLLFCTALHRHVSVLLLSDIAIMHVGCTILSAITLPLSSLLLSPIFCPLASILVNWFKSVLCRYTNAWIWQWCVGMRLNNSQMKAMQIIGGVNDW